MLRSLLVLLLLTLGLGFLAALPASAATCDMATANFTAVRNTGDLANMAAAYQAMAAGDVNCDTRVVHCAGDSLARAYVEASYAAADRGAAPGEVRSILEQGKPFGAPWQLLVGLGDALFGEARAAKNGEIYEKASVAYQDALNVITEEPVCGDFGEPAPPSAAEIEPVHKRMTEALLLAPRFEMIRTRAGGCGGIFLASIRGFKPAFRPIPITFVFGEPTFTPEGEKAAATLLACARQEKYSRIVMSGHTDYIGGDAANMALSKRRLDAVAAYLKAGGYAGKMVLEPKGESEAFVADDESAYSDDELRQLNRRVALRETAQ